MTTTFAIERATMPAFLRRVQISPTGCWLWQSATVKPAQLYGQLRWRGRSRLAHRAAYEEMVGPIPEGMELDHTCRTTLCIRPFHLEPVTPAVNRQRQGAAVTHCKAAGHALTPDNTRLTRTPVGYGRACKACAAEQQRRRNQRGY